MIHGEDEREGRRMVMKSTMTKRHGKGAEIWHGRNNNFHTIHVKTTAPTQLLNTILHVLNGNGTDFQSTSTLKQDNF